jgi:putative transposase
VTWAVREKGYSQRRACRLVGLHPKTYRYAPKRSGDEELRRLLRELASQRRRFGYRRLGLMLKRQGIRLYAKKLYRLYKEERLTVRKRGGRKRALGCVSAAQSGPHSERQQPTETQKQICLDYGVLIGADRDPAHLIISRSISMRCEAPSRGPASAPIDSWGPPPPLNTSH